MVGIWDFPEVDEFEEFLSSGLATARGIAVESVEDEDIQQVLEFISLEKILIVGDWGDGGAVRRATPLNIVVAFDVEGVENESALPNFEQAARTITQTFTALVNNGEIAPPPEADDWFVSYPPMEPIPANRIPENINRQLGDRVGATVADLTRKEAIQWRSRENLTLPAVVGENPVETIVAALPRIPFEQLRDEGKPEVEEEDAEELSPFDDDDDDEEEGEDAEEEPEPLSLEEQIREEIEQFSIPEDRLKIPAGTPFKRVDDRELYDFELQLGLAAEELEELEGFAQGDQLIGGIGFINEVKGVGTGEPAANFPRTSTYVKRYLEDRGPDYILSIYNNLVVYSGFISSHYGMNLKPGEYSSFREFMYRLHEIGERGGQELVERLSQQQAAARGLETTPDHPTIEDEKAPWLESRQYYDVIEENIDHRAWDNPTKFLYEELSDRE